jgi:hypothetical protein
VGVGMGYTYYGDLLGISGYYNLGSEIAKNKLNDFYDTTFFSLSTYCMANENVKVNMFSDSIFIWGDEPIAILKELQKVYIKLIHKGLLLRGAIVKGKLEYDPRIELRNYKKNLPTDDTLAKAVGLEKSQKGSRLLIEADLATELLYHKIEWLTIDGYIRDIQKSNNPFIDYDNILRRICPTPDNNSYELLYFWVCHNQLEHEDIDYDIKKNELNEISKMLTDKNAEHYKETIKLLDRCQRRQNYTREYLPKQ